MSTIIVSPLRHSKTEQTDWHSHQHGQLFWLEKGVALIHTDSANWTLTPSNVGWIPASIQHRALFPLGCEGYMLIENSHLAKGPIHAKLVSSDALIYALLDRFSQDNDIVADERVTRQLKVLYSEIEAGDHNSLTLPMPKDTRLKKLAHHLLATPDAPFSKSELAERFALSTRSISRLFRQQTGMTFESWRALAKLQHAIYLLEQGFSITDTAFGCGYSSDSAFISAFKRYFNHSPSDYRKKYL